MTGSKQTRRDFLVKNALAIAGTGLAAQIPERSLAGNPKPGTSREESSVGGSNSSKEKLARSTGTTASTGPRLYGLMADAARGPESVPYYRRLIDFCRQWNLNALLLTLTDDEGCALRFRSHPELLTHKHALTHDEAKGLANYAHDRGVELIPVVESFGHTQYITSVPRYAHLADRDPKSGTEFTGVIPVAPEALRLMTDIYREVAALFPSRYFHGGCDEVSWGGSELSRKALQVKSKAEIWAEYLNALDQVCRDIGKELIVWGDYVLHKEPDILPLLNKDIIVMDWQYFVADPAPLEQAARKVIENGNRVMGAPAVISCRWGPRPGSPVLRNIDAYADAYRQIDDPHALGVIATNWVPSRYIQRSIWDSFAYAAVALTEGSSVARASAFRRFVQKFYRAQWDENWADIFRTFYDITPNRKSCSPPWMRPVLPIPWRNEQELKATLKAPIEPTPPFVRLLVQLVFAEETVRKNFDDFLAFRLSAEYLEHLYWRKTVLAQEGADASSSKESASHLIQTIAERDHRLLDKLEADWDAGRPRDAASKLRPLSDFDPEDQLVFAFGQAASFSARLAREPGLFFQLLTAP